MRRQLYKWWKPALSVIMGTAVFICCLFPLRALLNYHEQCHLFRWNSFYLREHVGSWDGLLEFAVSFVTQFFYVGWLGALIVALLAVGVQVATWQLMRLVRLRSQWLYPLSYLPTVLLLYYGLIPQHFRDSAKFREIVSYDYLMRTHQWEHITELAAKEPPQSEQGIRATNHALAMQGRLPDDMFYYCQIGTKGLLADDQQQEPLAYCLLSDIYLRLGFINDAERLAFDAKQYLPNHHKSGRLYRRLAETNIINGNYTIAKKYLNFLRPTLYYGVWARNWLEHLGDEAYIEQQYGPHRQQRTSIVTHLIAPDKGIMLSELVQKDSTNLLALEYLLAYDLLTLKHERVLKHLKWAQRFGFYTRQAPRAVQECITGSWALYHPDAKELPIPVNPEVYESTKTFIQTISQTYDINAPSLNQPPFSQSYWYYHVKMLQQHNSLIP